MPDWSRPELLFGVTVPAESRRGEAGRAVIGAYRRRVLAVTAVSFLACWVPLLIGERITAGAVFVGLVIVGQIVALFWAFLGARRQALPLAAAPSGKRVALVEAEHGSMPGNRATSGSARSELASERFFVASTEPRPPVSAR
jgi:hypothetical protein